MARGKKKIIVYADWIDKFEELEDEEAGRLIKHFFRYVNDKNPEAPDRLTKLMFVDIKNALKRDLSKWEEKADERSEKARVAGIASAKARRLKKELNSTNELKKELNSTKSTVSVSDSVNVSTNVDVDSLYNVDVLKNYYLENDKVVNAIISNKDNKLSSKKQLEDRLTEFNEHMKQQRRLSEKFKEYSKYFLNWNRKKKEIETRSESKVSVSEWEQNPYRNS